MTRSFLTKTIRGTAYLLAMTLSGSMLVHGSPALAEATEVRFADQFGLLYLPLRVVVAQKLVEKHAAEAGLGQIHVTTHQFSGGGAVNTALLSGSVDMAAGGIPPLLKLWDRTKGTETEVRGAVTLSFMAYKLFTVDDRVKTIADYAKVTDHKIALPSVKVSTQAVTLEMAAQKAFGLDQAYKLDPLTVSMPHAQALAAMLSGGQIIKSHFATLPYSWELAKSGKAHLVFSSYDLVGPHTGVVMYNTKKWKDENPKLFKAVVAAFEEASAWINKNPDKAAEFFVKESKSPLSAKDVKSMITDKSEVEYRVDVKGTMPYAKFLHEIGDVKNEPHSWKDYFWESVYQFPGS